MADVCRYGRAVWAEEFIAPPGDALRCGDHPAAGPVSSTLGFPIVEVSIEHNVLDVAPPRVAPRAQRAAERPTQERPVRAPGAPSDHTALSGYNHYRRVFELKTKNRFRIVTIRIHSLQGVVRLAGHGSSQHPFRNPPLYVEWGAVPRRWVTAFIDSRL